MANCKYCGQDTKLIKAHIIPRSFYPESHKNGSAISVPSGKGSHIKRIPIGFYDANILCAPCDQKLGRIEEKAFAQMVNGQRVSIVEGHAVEYQNADNDVVRLFACALVWKSSISGHEAFERLECGPYEAKLLEVLRGEKEHPEIDAFVGEFDTDWPPFLSPYRLKLEGVNFVKLYAARFVIHLKLDQQAMPATFIELCLSRSNIVRTLLLEWRTSKERELMIKIVRNAKGMHKQLRRWKEKGLIK